MLDALGTIEAIVGPMFSGKTETLLARIRAAQAEGRRVRVFKHVLDGRYSESDVVSHAGGRYAATPVQRADEMLASLEPSIDFVAIDEGQFFEPELVTAVNALASRGVRVVVAGLILSYRATPFPAMLSLLAAADRITKLQSTCARCGKPANHSQRLAESEELVLTGGAGIYEPRCRACFVPHSAGE